jgi:hypothetical protein
MLDELGLPSGTWLNYERGLTTPAKVMLEFFELTGVESHWLLTGAGERYRAEES